MRRILRTVILLVVSCLAAFGSYGQSAHRVTDTVAKTPVFKKPKGMAAIKHEMSVGLRLNTNGWSVYTDIGKVKPKDVKRADMFYAVRLWQIEFTEKKDPREEKIVADNGSGSGQVKYIYGKINNFYAFKLGWGFRKLIVGKPDPGSVSIHWENVLGASIGLLKPYYLNVYSDPNAIKYTTANESAFLNQQLIEGSAGFGKGLSELTIIPGGHFKSAIHFDFSTNRKNAIGVEAGVNAEYYSQDIKLMADHAGTPYFVDMFVAISFGRRW